MYLSEQLQKKWGPVLEHQDLPEIKDPYKKAVTAILLENQENALREQFVSEHSMFLSEAAPTNAMSGANGLGGFTGASVGTGDQAIQFVDPVLISLVRRAMPNLIAYDICGVQPMTGPTGLIFAMRARYDNQSGSETFYNEPNTFHSGQNTSDGSAITSAQSAILGQGSGSPLDLALSGQGGGASVLEGESAGDGSARGAGSTGLGTQAGQIAEMAFSIERMSVEAKTRALKGEYSMELAQDLRAVHGLDAETELANILSTEILAEINREIVRTVYTIAKQGGANNTAAGTLDLSAGSSDHDGRWSVERFKSLMFQMEIEANEVAKGTRRGKGNIIITSADVASALQMAGVLDYGNILNGMNSLNVDDTGNTFAGVLNGRFKVYVDPYAGNFTAGSDNGMHYFVVGYKGSSAYDAGLFYCPYVPLQMVRAIGENTFQPKIGFKTRYGVVENPFSQGLTAGAGVVTANSNEYYRGVAVKGLLG